jgi:hypothetical protein
MHSLAKHATTAVQVFVISVLFCGAVLAAEFQAGVAGVDITPPSGYRLSGYFNERLSTGVKDPLHAKALVFKQGDVKAALVVCDLIGMAVDVTTHARRAASEQTGIPVANIAITATHSHTGPLYFGALREYFHQRAIEKHGRDPQEASSYDEALVEKLVGVIRQADKAAQPVQIDAGIAEENRLSFNRRFHMKDGSVRFNPGQQNPDIIRAAGPIDPDVGIVRFRTASSRGASNENGREIAALVVFAMHLDTLGGTEYSADYPFFLERELKKSHGPHFVSMFATGTCGDINHIDVQTKQRRTTQQIGQLLAETVESYWPSLKPIETPALAVRHTIVEAPLQKYTAEQLAQARASMPKIGSREMSFLDQVETTKIVDLALRTADSLPLEVQAFRLSPDTAIVTLPGEVFVELGLAIKRASPFKNTLVIELANDDPNYIPTKKAFAEGSYETVNSRVVPGSGERIAEAAIQLLSELAH